MIIRLRVGGDQFGRLTPVTRITRSRSKTYAALALVIGSPGPPSSNRAPTTSVSLVKATA
jgi:hypothetical protein